MGVGYQWGRNPGRVGIQGDRYPGEVVCQWGLNPERVGIQGVGFPES